MLTRRQFLHRTLQGSSLVALGPTVPAFLATTAWAAAPGKDTILVVLEMTGGNDGLNTVVPYADDNYHKARPTLRLTREQIVRLNDQVGLHPGLHGLEKLWEKGQLAVLQGVGYPNPDRSHFESMDIWHSADPRRKTRTGWLGRGLALSPVPPGQFPGAYIGTGQTPLALKGAAGAVPTIHSSKPYDLELSASFVERELPVRFEAPARAADPQLATRKQLIEELTELPPSPNNQLLQFVQRSSLQTYSTIARLRQLLNDENGRAAMRFGRDRTGELSRNLSLVARIIAAEFGTRIFYVALGSFDTHANQMQDHHRLLRELADAVAGFFTQLEQSGHSKRVVLMTFSEFGRRVQENASKGTDHGAASCVFVAGPAIQGGVLGDHPSLAAEDLDQGDLKHHTDFRRVYATLLDGWLGCASDQVLDRQYQPLALLKKS